jgi:hypothetical protein
MRKITKRSAAVIGATVVAIGGGAAWAATNGWDINGTGTAEGDAATIVEMTASANLGAKKVYPGLVTTVNTVVKNDNDFPVTLNTTNFTPTAVKVTGGKTASACETALDAAPNTLVASFPAGAPKILAKSPGQGVTTNIAVANTLPQSCAGTHITVTYTFTGVSTV